MAKQAGKGVEEFRPYVTRSIPVGANITCADTKQEHQDFQQQQ